MGRYVVKEQLHDELYNKKYFDDLVEAIDYVRNENKKYKGGTAKHRVVDLRSESIKYERGWIDRDLR